MTKETPDDGYFRLETGTEICRAWSMAKGNCCRAVQPGFTMSWFFIFLNYVEGSAYECSRNVIMFSGYSQISILFVAAASARVMMHGGLVSSIVEDGATTGSKGMSICGRAECP